LQHRERYGQDKGPSTGVQFHNGCQAAKPLNSFQTIFQKKVFYEIVTFLCKPCFCCTTMWCTQRRLHVQQPISHQVHASPNQTVHSLRPHPSWARPVHSRRPYPSWARPVHSLKPYPCWARPVHSLKPHPSWARPVHSLNPSRPTSHSWRPIYLQQPSEITALENTQCWVIWALKR
jgi:hypothetical protein